MILAVVIVAVCLSVVVLNAEANFHSSTSSMKIFGESTGIYEGNTGSNRYRLAFFSLDISGGAKGRVGRNPSSRSRVSSRQTSRKSHDEDDDYQSDHISITGKMKSKKPIKGKASRSRSSSSRGVGNPFQLISWSGSNRPKKKSKGPSLRERLEQLAKHGQSAYKEVYRRAKVLRSSAFEGILLKATWPGDQPVPPDLLTEIIKYSIPAFKYSRSDDETEDPYYLTMHKLWTKMWEKDWRTVTKSIYILHCISRDSAVDACRQFAAAIKDMSKTRNPKKPDHKYFDVRQISELDEASEEYQSFVKAYASFVLYRAKTFSNRLNEVRDIQSTMSEKKAVAWLVKARQLMTLGMQVAAAKGQRNIITGQALKLVAIDLRETWKIYNEKIQPLLGGGAGNYSEPRASSQDVAGVLSFAQDKREALQSFLTSTAKAFQAIKLKIPSDLSMSLVPADQLKERLAQLTAVSGGARRVSAPLDEEDEEDDDAEDDEGDEDEEEDSGDEDGDDDEEEDDDEADESGDEDEGEEDNSSADDEDDDEDEEGVKGDKRSGISKRRTMDCEEDDEEEDDAVNDDDDGSDDQDVDEEDDDEGDDNEDEDNY